MTTVEERLSRLEGVYEHLATKADLADLRGEMQTLRGEMQTGNSELRGEMQTGNSELRGEMQTGNSELRAEMARMESRLIRWMVGVMLGGLVATASITAAVATAAARFID